MECVFLQSIEIKIIGENFDPTFDTKSEAHMDCIYPDFEITRDTKSPK